MMASTINATVQNGVLTISVADGDNKVGSFDIRPADFSAAIRDAAMLHGFKQKIIDAAALSRDETTGRSATPEQKFHAMRDVVQQLTDGDWNRRATGDGTAGMGLLVAALVRLTGKAREDVETTVGTWTKEQQAAMRASAEVAPIIATIKAERAAKGTPTAPVDTKGLLAGFMAPKVANEPANEPAKPASKAKKAG